MPPSPPSRFPSSPGVGPNVFLRAVLSLTFLGGGLLLAEDFQGSAHKLKFDAPPIGYSSAEATYPYFANWRGKTS